MEDDAVWYEANARSGRDLAVLGGLIAALALLAMITPVSWTVAALVLSAVVTVGALVLCVRGVRTARALKKERGGS